MKKFIYILTIVAVLLSCVVVPASAAASWMPSGSPGQVFLYQGLLFGEEYPYYSINISFVDEFYTVGSQAPAYDNTRRNIYITSLVDKGQFQLLRQKDANASINDIEGFQVVSGGFSFSSFGYTYDITPGQLQYEEGLYNAVRCVDSNGNPVPCLVTIIRGNQNDAFTWIAQNESFLLKFCDLFRYSYSYGHYVGSQGAPIERPTLDPIVCNSTYKLTLNAGDKCVITFNETLASPKFKISRGGKYVGGLTVAADMRAGCSYTLVADETGDYYFDFYDTGTSVSGKYTIYRTLSDQKDAHYLQGFIDGMQQAPDDGSYANGVAAGEANILNQMREYMIAQGLTPQGNSVADLLSFYASSIGSSGSGSTDGSWQEGYNKGREDAENAAKDEITELRQELSNMFFESLQSFNSGKSAGREGIIDEMQHYILSKGFVPIESDDPADILEFYAGVNGVNSDQVYWDGYDDGKKDGIEIGKAEGFDSSFITDGIDSIVEGGSRTFLQVLEVEVLGYTLGSVVIGIIMVAFVFVAVKFIGSVL